MEEIKEAGVAQVHMNPLNCAHDYSISGAYEAISRFRHAFWDGVGAAVRPDLLGAEAGMRPDLLATGAGKVLNLLAAGADSVSRDLP